MPPTFQKPKRRVNCVFIHCSASDNPEHDSAATMDRWHRERGWSGIGYHYFIRKDGTIEAGRDIEKVPAAQRGNNVGSIAICLHGLDAEKFSQEQFDALSSLCDQINRAYRAQVTFHGHCEVSNKTCPVFDYVGVLGLIDGRMAITVAEGALQDRYAAPDKTPVAPGSLTNMRLRAGDRGADVEMLQRELMSLGYRPGKLDGIFGSLTRAAVLAFQADNDLATDGIVGPVTLEAFDFASKRQVAPERAKASLLTLATSGSRIARGSLANGIAGLALSGGGVIALVQELTGAVDDVNGIVGPLQGVLSEHGPVVGGAVIAIGLFIAWQSARTGKARLEDHRNAKTL
ncbi:peptidoglycan recognition protein family protein [Oceaniglobus trochenteri]|uniref:peptidoglycan recognition protein family protein n=1 Tax=Oceaniglobus trochenteri TaxID=2763260 RepID=UPI001CFFF5F9|nr:peptidoglycan-binding domain-containing protein [Oceaniglobus trochenteri]